MKPYLLKRLVSTDWVEACAFVVVAEDERRARQMAFAEPYQDNGIEWLDPLKASCTEIDLSIEQVVLGDYR